MIRDENEDWENITHFESRKKNATNKKTKNKIEKPTTASSAWLRSMELVKSSKWKCTEDVFFSSLVCLLILLRRFVVFFFWILLVTLIVVTFHFHCFLIIHFIFCYSAELLFPDSCHSPYTLVVFVAQTKCLTRCAVRDIVRFVHTR